MTSRKTGYHLLTFCSVPQKAENKTVQTEVRVGRNCYICKEKNRKKLKIQLVLNLKTYHHFVKAEYMYPQTENNGQK